MRFLNYISGLAMVLTLGACSDEAFQGKQDGIVDNGDQFTIDISLDVSDMMPSSTRSFGETPNYNDLKLIVAEFEGKGGPLDGNTLSEVCKVSDETLNSDGDIHFKLTLTKRSDARVLHLIAVPKSVDITIPYGLEGDVIPALTVSGESDAYWQRLEFPEGYGEQDGDTWTTHSDVKTKLTHVPMIRNFSKITVSSTAQGFTLEGFVIVNAPKKATVAPWNSSSMTFPKFLDETKTTPTMLEYGKVEYDGYFPFDNVDDVNTVNTDQLTETTFNFNGDAKYLYERPSSSINNTYLLIKGKRGGASMYYKLDIGKNNDQNIFRYHNIIRNFWYEIKLNKVDSDGYATVEEAIRGVVYNNFSFDVNTRQMRAISDGQKMIWVNKTTFVVNDVDSTTVKFQYRFDDNIAAAGYNTDKLKFIDEKTGEEITNDNIKNLSDGMITSWSSATNVGTEGWKQTEFKTVDPTDRGRSYAFIAYDKDSGIGRTINVIVRQPWEYIDLGVWGGNYNTRKQFINTSYPKDQWEGFVSTNSAGQPLTVVFTIDNELPESIFPLTFTLEAELQNIENNKIGTLVVTSGSSFFDGQNSNRIKYEKTVTWTEYNTELSLNNITGTKVTHDDGTVLHRVRCRFLTIMQIDNATERKIRIHNDYFKVKNTTGNTVTYSKYGEVSFKGKTGIAPNWGITGKEAEVEPMNKDDVTYKNLNP